MKQNCACRLKKIRHHLRAANTQLLSLTIYQREKLLSFSIYLSCNFWLVLQRALFPSNCSDRKKSKFFYSCKKEKRGFCSEFLFLLWHSAKIWRCMEFFWRWQRRGPEVETHFHKIHPQNVIWQNCAKPSYEENAEKIDELEKNLFSQHKG